MLILSKLTLIGSNKQNQNSNPQGLLDALQESQSLNQQVMQKLQITQEEYRQAIVQIQQQKKEYEALQFQHQEQNNNISNMQSYIQDIEQKYKIAQEENKKLLTEINELENNLKSKNFEIDQLQQHKQSLFKQHQQQEEQNQQQLQKQLNTFAEKIYEAQTKTSNIQEIKRQNIDRITQRQEEIDKKNNSYIEELQQQNLRLTEQINQLQIDGQEKEVDNNLLKRQLATMKQEFEQQHAEFTYLQEQQYSASKTESNHQIRSLEIKSEQQQREIIRLQELSKEYQQMIDKSQLEFEQRGIILENAYNKRIQECKEYNEQQFDAQERTNKEFLEQQEEQLEKQRQQISSLTQEMQNLIQKRLQIQADIRLKNTEISTLKEQQQVSREKIHYQQEEYIVCKKQLHEIEQKLEEQDQIVFESRNLYQQARQEITNLQGENQKLSIEKNILIDILNSRHQDFPQINKPYISPTSKKPQVLSQKSSISSQPKSQKSNQNTKLQQYQQMQPQLAFLKQELTQKGNELTQQNQGKLPQYFQEMQKKYPNTHIMQCLPNGDNEGVDQNSNSRDEQFDQNSQVQEEFQQGQQSVNKLEVLAANGTLDNKNPLIESQSLSSPQIFQKQNQEDQIQNINTNKQPMTFVEPQYIEPQQTEQQPTEQQQEIIKTNEEQNEKQNVEQAGSCCDPTK